MDSCESLLVQNRKLVVTVTILGIVFIVQFIVNFMLIRYVSRGSRRSRRELNKVLSDMYRDRAAHFEEGDNT